MRSARSVPIAPIRGVDTGSRYPASIAMPSTTNATPMTTVAYLAFASIQLVTYSDTMPTTTNTVRKPAETAPETTSARRTDAR